MGDEGLDNGHVKPPARDDAIAQDVQTDCLSFNLADVADDGILLASFANADVDASLSHQCPNGDLDISYAFIVLEDAPESSSETLSYDPVINCENSHPEVCQQCPDYLIFNS